MRKPRPSKIRKVLTVNCSGRNRVEMPLINRGWAGGPPVRGLHFVLGWQVDRIRLELPYFVSLGVSLKLVSFGWLFSYRRKLELTGVLLLPLYR